MQVVSQAYSKPLAPVPFDQAVGPQLKSEE